MTAKTTEPQVAKRYAIGRYENRVLVSQRIADDVVQITDVAEGAGPSYVVETLTVHPGMDLKAEIQGIANAYLDDAAERGCCPLAPR